MSWVRSVKKLVRSTVRKILAEEIETHIPCRVISYDNATNLVNLQPCIEMRRVYDAQNMTTIQLPPINDVPVELFGSGNLVFTAAPQTDSYGVLHVSKHRLETWLSSGGIVSTNSAIVFDRDSGFFRPGLYHLVVDGNNGKLQGAVQTDRMSMRNRAGDKEISLVDDGTVVLVESVDYAVQYTALKSAFDQLKSDFDGHVHLQALPLHPAVPPQGPTGAPTVASTADMSGSKIDSIRVP